MLRMIFLCWWCYDVCIYEEYCLFRYRSLDTVSHLIRIYALINTYFLYVYFRCMAEILPVIHELEGASPWFWYLLVHLGGVMGCREIEEQAHWLGDQSLGAYWLPFCRCFSKSFLGKMRATWFLFGAFWNWWIDHIIGFDVDTIRMGVDKIWDYICTYRLDRVE